MIKVVKLFLFTLVGLTTILASNVSAFAQENTARELEIISNIESVLPGETFIIAFRPKIQEQGIYSFWRQGLSGLDSRLDKPESLSMRRAYWAPLQVTTIAGEQVYGFDGDDYIGHAFILPQNATELSDLTVSFNYKAALCQTNCSLQTFAGSITIPLGNGALNSEHTETFNNMVENALPNRARGISTRAGEGYISIGLILNQEQQSQISGGKFLPLSQNVIPAGEALTFTQTPTGLFGVNNIPNDLSDQTHISGILAFTNSEGNLTNVHYTNDNNDYINIDLNAGVEERGSGSSITLTILSAALFAFIGGIILNVMPCVFPILAMKAMSLVKMAGGTEAEARRDSTFYTLGILASFAVFATLVVFLQSTGEKIGWGFQLQSTPFVVVLMIVLFLVGLNFLGLFEVTSRFGGFGQSLTEKGGKRGPFFTGALATLVATPCTAPFMAPAITFALGQTTPVIFITFMSLGLGLAFPYLLISFVPALRSKLPKPGPWVKTFNQFLAFPIFATVIWLLWVVSVQKQTPSPVLSLSLILLVGLGVWIYNKVTEKQILLKGLATSLVIITAVLIAPMNNMSKTSLHREAGFEYIENIKVIPYSAEQVNVLRSEGKGVFLHFWAAWCVICLMHENTVYDTDEFHDYLKENDIVFMKIDNTLMAPESKGLMESFGRSGQPLDVFFPGDLNKSVVVLPELFTTSTVLDHMNNAMESQ